MIARIITTAGKVIRSIGAKLGLMGSVAKQLVLNNHPHNKNKPTVLKIFLFIGYVLLRRVAGMIDISSEQS
jgi:hypothetical protein